MSAHDGGDVVEAADAGHLVSENLIDLGLNVDAEPPELFGVGGALQQRGDFRAALELAGVHVARAAVGAHEKAGEPDERDRRAALGGRDVLKVGKGALRDDRGARL